MRGWLLIMLLALGGLTACGGDPEPAGSSAPASDSANDGDKDETTSSGEVRLEEPTLTTEPGTAYAEVGGSRLTYSSTGSLAYFCDIAADRVQINFQTNEGNDLLIEAALQGEDWIGRASFKAADGENVQYGAQIPADAMPLVVGAESLSFEGSVTRIEDFDAANPTTVDATLAVNCAVPGGVPTAEIDGETYAFNPSGSQSVTCTVAGDEIEILINRLAVDNLQLQVSSRRDGDALIGNVSVYTPEGRFTSSLREDGAGLEVDGSSVSYSGTFTGDTSDEVEGTVSVTCP